MTAAETISNISIIFSFTFSFISQLTKEWVIRYKGDYDLFITFKKYKKYFQQKDVKMDVCCFIEFFVEH